ncbi:hypothetical protein MUK70_12780 [Dyadobacter chenwenxiniae]|uniref:hypothetical protein n=1 Tax=Dyadobacter chenwenxiniae TaxID=2906456 RepID=UPI001FD11391|nr:hypothetical protein [Dyadobacter chenwenxiniae]UON85856.1 hypothetical protein MUK70_12780 [Dyadobacter chenwenxiniae]
MGISPGDLRYITPYEFNLLREGHFKQRRDDYYHEWERARFQAHTVYASVTALVSGEIDPIETFYPLPTDKDRKEAIAALPVARKIDPDYKAAWEAKMNAIK